jgi:hypothetical protein
MRLKDPRKDGPHGFSSAERLVRVGIGINAFFTGDLPIPRRLDRSYHVVGMH